MVTCNKINDSAGWGRLGNQLWALSNVVGYSKKHDIPWRIPKWKYSQYFEGPFNEIDTVLENCIDVVENGFHYTELPNITGSNINLMGYWQSRKYWEHCEEDVLTIFTFTPEVIKEVKRFMMQSLCGNANIGYCSTAKIPVFVHVRRGDYVQGMAHYYHKLTLDWYAQAMNNFNPDTHHFFVLSDDIEFCRKHFTTANTSFSHFDEIHDLCLMSECSHGIMANSSFSFWGQFLIKNPNKIIIAPAKDKWFKPVAGHNMDDLYHNQNWKLL